MFKRIKESLEDAHFHRRGYPSPRDMFKLLDAATFAHLPIAARRDRLSHMHQYQQISTNEYLQLLDAANHHSENGNYVGCIMYNNAPDEHKYNERELKTRALRLSPR